MMTVEEKRGDKSMKREMCRRRKQQRRKAIRSYFLMITSICLVLIIVCASNDFSIRSGATEEPGTYKYFTEVRVTNGMTLWDIARKYISAEYESVDDYIKEVKEINSIYTDEIYYGQSLMVPYYSSELK